MLKFLYQKSAPSFKKVPKKILILSPGFDYYPTISSEVDFHPKNTKYDLLIYIDKKFRLDVEYPFCIGECEIWFERGDKLTETIFNRALRHYSECELRNGK